MFLWSVSGWHGSVSSAADTHGAAVALVATGEPGWELCTWLPGTQRVPNLLVTWTEAETSAPE